MNNLREGEKVEFVNNLREGEKVKFVNNMREGEKVEFVNNLREVNLETLIYGLVVFNAYKRDLNNQRLV